MVSHLFSTWPFRKLYFEIPAFNLPAFRAGLDAYLHVEARFRDHTFTNGRYWDSYVAALSREDWERVSSRFLKHYGVVE